LSARQKLNSIHLFYAFSIAAGIGLISDSGSLFLAGMIILVGLFAHSGAIRFKGEDFRRRR